MAEVSASAPVKLCLSFTTGCSTPSFQTTIHPLLLCPSLLSHSLALRYGLWHQAGLYAITQRGDSEAPAVNAVAVLWCDKYISRHKCNVHACIHPECIYVHHSEEGRAVIFHLSWSFFSKQVGKHRGAHLLDQSYSGHLVPRSCCWQAGWLLAKSLLTRGSLDHWHLASLGG